MKAKFSIPFNGDLALLAEALRSGQVCEVYFALPGRKLGASGHFVSGRGAGGDIPAMLRLCRAAGAKVNLLFNSPTLALTPLPPLFAAARRLRADSVTLADPLCIARFAQALPGVRLQASVIMNVSSEERARQVLRAGIRTLTPAAEAARDLPLLRRLAGLRREFPGLRLKLMPNYSCGYDCAFMHAHYLSGMFGVRGGAPGGADCSYGGESWERLKRPFIRPEDLPLYERAGVADEFKLIARHQDSADLRRVYGAYFSRRFDGDLGLLLGGSDGDYGKARGLRLENRAFPAGFARKVAACDKRCARCGYCRRVFRLVAAGGEGGGRGR